MFYVRRTLGEVVRICEKKTLWAELSTTAMNIVSMVIACQTSSQCVHLFVRWWEDISWKEKKSNAYVVCLLIDHTHTHRIHLSVSNLILCAQSKVNKTKAEEETTTNAALKFVQYETNAMKLYTISIEYGLALLSDLIEQIAIYWKSYASWECRMSIAKNKKKQHFI